MSQLPIAMPPITSYPFVADLLAVLWAHKSLTAPWIFERYIQLQVEVNNDPPILDFYALFYNNSTQLKRGNFNFGQLFSVYSLFCL